MKFQMFEGLFFSAVLTMQDLKCPRTDVSAEGGETIVTGTI